MPEEPVDWETFIQKFKSTACRVEGKRIICEGLLGDEPAVCEVSQKDGKPEVSCRRFVEGASPV